ncbi:superoxide dismutase [Sediminibacillus massiliensis]|uniref:superoxide dismutase n=1 Tax=Sediminibacillus massiliensis TaxID=1926277 RepID=UPI000988875C|nr:superoxide dismutase [Sediminibacillus massiliensis]
MNDSKKDYLNSLLQWGKDIEEKIEGFDLDKKEAGEWKKQLVSWKGMVIDALEMQNDPPDEKIAELEEKSQILLSLLKLIISKKRNVLGSVGIGRHRLPDLPYPYDALEPYISSEIMRLHHDRHHKSYVDGLNKAEREIYSNPKDDKLLKHWQREQAFNGSGHFLHTLFWENMTPDGGGKPKGELLNQLEKDFGSFSQFKRLFTSAAESVEGVGWAVLVWEFRSGRLAIQTVEKHQMFSLWDVFPLLVLDVWEHAYYLQYKNDRSQYVKNWWNVVNWPSVATRLEKAKQINIKLY